MTLSVVCLLVECTRRQRKGNAKNIQRVVGWRGWKWIERSVVLLLIQKEIELLYIIFFMLWEVVTPRG